MVMNNVRPGLGSVGAYQVSGMPFITGSANLDQNKVHMVEFPRVTKSVTVINTNTGPTHSIRVHFQSGSTIAAGPVTVPGENGAKTTADTRDVFLRYHYITVPPGNGSVTMDVRCSKLYISNNVAADLKYEVYAELTTVPSGDMPHLSGSGITE